MEFLYYILFLFIFSSSYQALPLNEDNKKVLKPEDLIVFRTVYLIPQTAEKNIQKRQADYLRDESSSDESQKDDFRASEARYYTPYFRIRRVYTSYRNQPRYPASNYADSYDRFPTVA